MIRTSLSALFTVLTLLPVAAQNNFNSGTYMAEEDPMEFTSFITFYDFTPTDIRQMSYSEGALYYTMEQSRFTDEDGIDYQQEGSAYMKNNAIAYWINSCKECGWTETQVANFFYIGSPYIYYFKHNRFVNNVDADEVYNYTFEDFGKSFTTEASGYLRLIPSQLMKKDDIRIGAQSNENIEIREIRITEQTTEITLRLRAEVDNYMCFLNAPGNADAFEITDSKGNKYALLSSFGWPGENGYGSITLEDEGDEIDFILFFEAIPQTTDRISLKEGNCSSGCWNFYDISYIAE